MKTLAATTLTAALIMGFSCASNAEYLIYLKGGHYIVADNCTFSTRQVMRKDAETEEKTVVVEDCTKGRPERRIFWSTIDGKFGEVNADEVYYIYGSKGLASIAPERKAKPLEDYLIVNRGDSFINAKVVSESEGRVYGVKRDDLADINRRGVTEIVPLADAKSRSGEGLCPGEGAEFDVTETDYSLGNFVGTFKNLSRESCMEATFEVEVKVNETFVDKFQVRDSSAVSPGRSKHISKEVPAHLREYVKRSKNREGGVQLCWTKVQSSAQCQADIREQRR
jgi:hypothetical protein